MPAMKSAAPAKPIKPIVAKPVIARPNVVAGKPAPKAPVSPWSPPQVAGAGGMNRPYLGKPMLPNAPPVGMIAPGLPPSLSPRTDQLQSFIHGINPLVPGAQGPRVPIGRGGTAPWVTNLQNALYNKVMPPIQRKVAEAQRAGQAWWGDLTGGTLGR